MEVNVPQNGMAFYATYPQTDFSVYMGAPMNPGISETLYNYFGKNFIGKNQVELTSDCLNSLKKRLPIKRTKLSLGMKMVLPDELFYYPFVTAKIAPHFSPGWCTTSASLMSLAFFFPGHMSIAGTFPG